MHQLLFLAVVTCFVLGEARSSLYKELLGPFDELRIDQAALRFTNEGIGRTLCILLILHVQGISRSLFKVGWFSLLCFVCVLFACLLSC